MRAGDAKPLVTVIVPTRNRFELTAEAIASVQAQIYPMWELNVVDDASDDDSLGRLREFVAGDDRIRFIALSERVGQSRARQAGFEISEAPLVALLDSDDLWLPGKLTAQVAHLLEASEHNSRLGLVSCRTVWVNIRGAPAPRRWRPFQVAPRPSGLPAPFANMSAPLFTRGALQAAGGLASPAASELVNAEHIEFALRQAETSEAAMVDQVLVICRSHPTDRGSDSLGTRSAADGLAKALELHRSLLERWPSDRASLTARVGARYLAAGEPVGYRYLARALGMGGFRDTLSLSRRYGPFALRRMTATLGTRRARPSSIR